MRPNIVVPPDELEKYNPQNYLTQVKLDGSCAVLITDGTDNTKLYRRHGGSKQLSNWDRSLKEQFRQLAHGPTLLVGEYLNKNKKGEDGQPFNHKLVLFDVMAIEGQYLMAKTTEERYQILLESYKVQEYSSALWQVSNDVFIVKNLLGSPGAIFDTQTQTELYEGIVMKPKGEKLTLRGSDQKTRMFKSRRKTKNYKY